MLTLRIDLCVFFFSTHKTHPQPHSNHDFISPHSNLSPQQGNNHSKTMGPAHKQSRCRTLLIITTIMALLLALAANARLSPQEFSLVDENHDARVSPGELRDWFGARFPSPVVNELIKDIGATDLNSDGLIAFDEFLLKRRDPATEPEVTYRTQSNEPDSASGESIHDDGVPIVPRPPYGTGPLVGYPIRGHLNDQQSQGNDKLEASLVHPRPSTDNKPLYNTLAAPRRSRDPTAPKPPPRPKPRSIPLPDLTPPPHRIKHTPPRRPRKPTEITLSRDDKPIRTLQFGSGGSGRVGSGIGMGRGSQNDRFSPCHPSGNNLHRSNFHRCGGLGRAHDRQVDRLNRFDRPSDVSDARTGAVSFRGHSFTSGSNRPSR